MMNKEENKIRYFTDLYAWQEAHKLVLMVYKTTKTFPTEELYGLTSQIRRAVVSVTSNIAEGFTRYSYKEKIQFYAMSRGSLTEVQNQLVIARDIKYLDSKVFGHVADQSILVSKILYSINKLIKTIPINTVFQSK